MRYCISSERITERSVNTKIMMALIALAFMAVLSVAAIGISNDSDAAAGDIFLEGGLNYEVTSENPATVSVVQTTFKYSGDVTIPSSVTHDNVTYSVTAIGDNAFKSCSDLTSVTMPNSILSIGNYAFNDDTNKFFTSITIPSSVAYIGDYAFSRTKISSITIPASVTTMGTNPFKDANLTSIVVDSANTNYCSDNGVLFDKNKTELIAYPRTNSATSYTIPSTVLTIGEYAFHQSANLNTITIPSGVKTIGDWAFYSCKITSLNIPDSVTSIGMNVFNFCGHIVSFTVDPNNAYYCSDGGVLFDKNKTELIAYPIDKSGTSYTIPSTVTTIREYAFNNCSGLTTITIPFGVKTIGDTAFRCTGITSLSLPNSVEKIGNNAFEGCTITSLTIPSSVTSIGDYAFFYTNITTVTIPATVTTLGLNPFYNCPNLTDISVDSGNPNYCSIDGVLFDKDKTVLISYPTAKSDSTYDVPDTVNTIGDYAFFMNRNITSVDMPSGLTSIEAYAFNSCSYLASADIPSGVTSIGIYAFASCVGLTSVTIPSGITSIEASTFNYCKIITSVTIPSNVTSIGEYAFNNCQALASVKVANDTVPGLYSNAFNKCNALSEILVPSGSVDSYKAAVNWSSYADKIYTDIATCTVDDIADQFYTGQQITPEVVVKDGTDILVKDADYTVSYGENTQLGEGTVTITGIGEYRGTYIKTFYIVVGWNIGAVTETDVVATYNTATKTLTISGTGAMKDWTGSSAAPWIASYKNEMTTVVISDGVTNVGAFAFKDCSKVAAVTLGKDVTTIGTSAFNGCTKLASITIADSITAINESAFYGCSKLATVTFGDDSSLQTIGKTAFYSCTSLLSIDIPDSVTSIGEEAFAQSSKLASVAISANSSLETISVAAFKLTALTSFFIPKNVTTIGERFTVNTPISAYTVDGNNQNYCSDDKGVLFNKNKTELIAYPEKGAVSYDIPDTVTAVRAYAFYQSSVQTVGLGKVVTIGTHAFNTCEALTSVTIPATVTTIASRAFGSCYFNSVAVYTSGNETSFASDIFDLIFRIDGVEIETDSAAFPGHVYIYNEYLDTLDDSGVAKTWNISATENDSVTADYNGYTKTFTISGTGAMKDWTSEIVAPWHASYGDEIETVVIENGVTNIGARAFDLCENLKSVSIPDSVISIGAYAFTSTGITSIDISAYVTAIGDSAFTTDTLTSVNVSDQNQNYCDVDGVLFNKDMTRIMQYPAAKEGDSYTIPDTIITISENAFCYAPFTSVTITGAVTTIEGYAFTGSHLTSVTIPANVASIGDGAFTYNTSLGEVTVQSKTAPSLGVSAFLLCSEDFVILVPSDSVDSYKTAANWSTYSNSIFAGITACTVDDIEDQFYTGSQITPEVTVKDGTKTLVKNADYTVSYGENIQLGEGTVTITGAGIYKGIIEKTFNIVIGWDISATENDHVKAVYDDETNILTISGTGNMKGWTSETQPPWYKSYRAAIETVVIENGVTNIGSYVFAYCGNITSVTIPDSVTTIGTSAFTGTGILSIDISAFVTVIEDSAFIATDLISINVSEQNQNYSDVDGILFNKDKTKIIQYPDGREDSSYSIPDTVRTIGRFAFYNSQFTSVTIPDEVTAIEFGAFSLTHLTSVVIPKNVTTIGGVVFGLSTDLTTVTVMSETAPALGEGAFTMCPTDLTIFVPSKSVDSYKAAENWSSYSGKIFADLTLCTVDDIKDQTYTGQQITPAVTVKDGTKTLVRDTDYTVEYGDNVAPGEGTVTITGAGIYKGIIEKTFNIVKMEPKITVNKTSSCPSGSYNVGASVNNGAALTYVIIAGSDIASVDSAGMITAKAVGTAKLKITSAETETYKAGELTVDITVYDHIHVIVPGKAPTKTDTGLTEGEECSECHKVFKEQTSIPATGSEKSVVESSNSEVKYAVPKSDDLKTLTVKLADSKYVVDLNEESTAAVKDKVIEFSITPVEKKNDQYSAVLKSGGEEFNGKMDITLPYDPAKGTPSVKWIEGNEKMTTVSINETDKTITFTTTHNSTYEVEYQKQVDGGVVLGIWMIPVILLIVLIVALMYTGSKIE